MPPKGKGAAKPAPAKEPQAAKQPEPTKPRTVNEKTWAQYYVSRPFQKAFEERGLADLSPLERQGWINSQYLAPGAAEKRLSKKAQKELSKQIAEQSIPPRGLPKPSPGQWGVDKYGRDVGESTLEDFEARKAKIDRLFRLWGEHRRWERKKLVADKGCIDAETGEACKPPTEEETAAEKERRDEMATLKLDLYGVKISPYANDPAWDDVVPIPQEEPEGALAAIAYPEDYAESMGYLRAVMVAHEYSPRCLKLTEHIISLNPAHYTVWLYRFDIVKALKISVPDEIVWLNEVAMEHLKNYQIWHHRQLLIDEYFGSIASSPEVIEKLADSETLFLTEILAEDTKNYHVWTYRHYLVSKLGMWNDKERSSIETMIDDDVRNNSAWSHRFFLVFTDPSYSTPESHATEHDPKLPAEIVDREVEYAKMKISLAPQNQSPWNYLKGALVKGGRKLGSVQEFAEGFVKDLGEDDEVVKSSHALDFLADCYKAAGEKEKADLCLKRLGEKWDRVRVGYWEWRRKMLNVS